MPTLWDSLEHDRVAIPAAVVEPTNDVSLRVAGHLLALHLQQHVLQSKTFLNVVVYLAYFGQRWASTLANRSNARHRSNIRAPPRPLPLYVCIQSVGICEARGAGSDS